MVIDMTVFGYIRTSRRQREGEAGSDPDSQRLALERAGVDPADIYRDVGVSGATGTSSRDGWRALDLRLAGGDVLTVVSIDRIGRSWLNTVTAIRDLRGRGVKVRSLNPVEASWAAGLEADQDSPDAFAADMMMNFAAWVAGQEAALISNRTKAGLQRARAEGKTLGHPRVLTDEHVDAMRELERRGASRRSLARMFGVGRTTVARYLDGQ